MKTISRWIYSIALVCGCASAQLAYIQSPASNSLLIAGSTVTFTWNPAITAASPHSWEYAITISQVTYQSPWGFQIDPNAATYFMDWDSTTATLSQPIVIPATTGPLYVTLSQYIYVANYGWALNNTTANYTITSVSPGMSVTGTIADQALSNIADYDPATPVSDTGPGGIMFGYAQVILPKGTIKNPKKRGPPKIERPTPETVYVKRGDMINIGALSYSHMADATGSTRYSYTFDNRQVANLALGHPDGPSAGVIATTQPAKWIGSNAVKGIAPLQFASWAQWKGAALSPQASYTVLSDQLPGVVLMRFQSDWSGMLSRLNGVPAPSGFILSKTAGWGEMDGHLIASASGVWGNSLVKLVIGPVFDPNPKVADLVAAVKDWVANYNLTGLTPATAATDAVSLHAALSSIAPSSQIEKDAIESLLKALSVAH